MKQCLWVGILFLFLLQTPYIKGKSYDTLMLNWVLCAVKGTTYMDRKFYTYQFSNTFIPLEIFWKIDSEWNRINHKSILNGFNNFYIFESYGNVLVGESLISIYLLNQAHPYFLFDPLFYWNFFQWKSICNHRNSLEFLFSDILHELMEPYETLILLQICNLISMEKLTLHGILLLQWDKQESDTVNIAWICHMHAVFNWNLDPNQFN